MSLAELLQPESVLLSIKVNTPKQLLQLMSVQAAQLIGENADVIYNAVLQRGRAGITYLENGVAVPYGRLKQLKKTCVIFARLDVAVYFSPANYVPTDLIFLVLSPENMHSEYLQALAKIARFVKNENVVEPLRKLQDEKEVYRFLCETSQMQLV